jgi:hypothetical protein
MESGALGKKVFFLYPPPVLTEVIDFLARQEFEVFLARDHEKLRRFIASFPDAILFANIDSVLDDEGWQAYVAALRKEAPALGIGILTLNDNAMLRERYLMDIQVQCGFVILNIGATKTAEILSKTLEANEARGRRKFVRAPCPPGAGQFAVDIGGTTLRGELTDLSSAGMAIRSDDDTSLRVGTLLRDISLSIKGNRVLVSGVIVAKHPGDKGGRDVDVVMFTPDSLDEARREKLKSIVFKINQLGMELALERA